MAKALFPVLGYTLSMLLCVCVYVCSELNQVVVVVLLRISRLGFGSMVVGPWQPRAGVWPQGRLHVDSIPKHSLVWNSTL